MVVLSKKCLQFIQSFYKVGLACKVMKLAGKTKEKYDILLVSPIAAQVLIKVCPNKHLENTQGTILHESSAFFTIQTKEKKNLKIPKKNTNFELSLDKGNYLIDGNALQGTLVQRIKKLR